MFKFKQNNVYKLIIVGILKLRVGTDVLHASNCIQKY